MSGVGNVILTVGTATIINSVYDLQTGKQDAAVTLLAGATTGAILVVVGSSTGSWELVEAVGVAILVGSLFLHGSHILGINTALQSKSAPVSHSTTNQASGNGGSGVANKAF